MTVRPYSADPNRSLGPGWSVTAVASLGAADRFIDDVAGDHGQLLMLVLTYVRSRARAWCSVPPVRLMMMPTALSMTPRVANADRSFAASRWVWASTWAFCTAIAAGTAKISQLSRPLVEDMPVVG